ncbi:DUF3887 domain-containing protein [Phormidium tenue FACHB-886]|nr:DUF3887 domain-containing protein [Phormidium tenue FACHB-886]
MQFRLAYVVAPLALGFVAATAQPSIAQTAPLAESIAQTPSTDSMPAIAEKFVTLSSQGDFVGASQYLHPTMRQNWSPTDMENAWRTLQERTGAFQQFLSYEQAGNDVVLVSTQFENVTDDLVVIFDDTQQWIVGVDFPQP